MKSYEFTVWLKKKRFFSSKKLITDCVCRVARVERALGVDFDEEYQRDRGEWVLFGIKRYGKNLLNEGYPKTDLPIGTTGFCMLQQAVKKYFLYKEAENGLE